MFDVEQFDVKHFRLEGIIIKEVGREINIISHMIKNAFDAQKSLPSFANVHWPIGHIIRFLADNTDRDIFQKDIESFLGTTRSTVSKVLDNMEKNGFIERKSVQTDARLKKLVLTEKSVNLVEQIKSYKSRIESTIRLSFTDDETDVLFDFLERIENNLMTLPEVKQKECVTEREGKIKND